MRVKAARFVRNFFDVGVIKFAVDKAYPLTEETERRIVLEDAVGVEVDESELSYPFGAAAPARVPDVELQAAPPAPKPDRAAPAPRQQRAEKPAPKAPPAPAPAPVEQTADEQRQGGGSGDGNPTDAGASKGDAPEQPADDAGQAGGEQTSAQTE